MDVVIWGMGKLGQVALRTCAVTSGVEVVAVVTRRPEAVDETLAIPVLTELDAVAERFPEAFVLHANHALGRELEEELERCVVRGLDVVTSCGLGHPASQSVDGGRHLNEQARAHGTHVVTSGLQPGLYFDVLPALTLPLAVGWSRAHVVKGSSAVAWPPDNRQLHGIGCPPSDLEAAPIPFPMSGSAYLLAESLGLELTKLCEERSAITSAREVVLRDGLVARGMASGFRQTCVAEMSSDHVVTLVWDVSVDPSAVDTVYRLTATGPGQASDGGLHVTMDGDFNMDPYAATVARMLQTAMGIRGKPSGLWSVLDASLSRSC